MVQAIIMEMGLQHDFMDRSEKIETIYFGGGTPSLLDSSELNAIMNQIHRQFSVVADAEVTLEANPDDVKKMNIDTWSSSGINRYSIGIQSFSDKELKWMNRAHDSHQALESIKLLQDQGIRNISTDLIFGGPFVSDDELHEHIDILVSHQIPHVSAYALTVENKTILHHQIKTNQLAELDSEKQSLQFLLTGDLLGSAGYEHYEISNYAMPGMRSRHNSSYWQGKPYYGFGPSAHSFNGKNIRRWNMANNAMYVSNIKKGLLPAEEEILTNEQQINEYIMTSLRTMEGIDMEYVSAHFGSDVEKKIMHLLSKHIDSGKVIVQAHHAQLSREGKLFADGIAADLFL